MISFEYPWILFLIVPLGILLWLFYDKGEEGPRAFFPLVDWVDSPRPRKTVTVVGEGFLWFSLLLALAMPYRGYKQEIQVQRSRTLSIVMDSSGSIDDVQRSAFKKSAPWLVKNFKDDMLCVVIFAGEAAGNEECYNLAKKSGQGRAIKTLRLFDSFDVGASTELGRGLFIALVMLARDKFSDEELGTIRGALLEGVNPWRALGRGKNDLFQFNDRAVVVFSDVMLSDTRLHHNEMLRVFADLRIPVYIISLGGKKRKEVPEVVRYVELTRGKYYYIPSTFREEEVRKELVKLFAEISNLERQETEAAYITVKDRKHIWFIGLALFVVLIMAGYRYGMAKK